MENLTAFVYYLLGFRLAIIAAGITSIILGYRLFVRGVFPFFDNRESREAQNVTAKIAGAEFTLHNAAPGTCFALFGVIIIVAMVIAGGPEATLEVLGKGQTKIAMRGSGVKVLKDYSAGALEQLRRGRKNEASAIAHSALDVMAGPLNDLAWVLMDSEAQNPQAALMAELAVSIEPDNPYFLHTLAVSQFNSGTKQKALHTLEQAQTMKPLFGDQIRKWRNHLQE